MADMLDLQGNIRSRFAKKYVDLWDLAVRGFKEEVKNFEFPTKAQTFKIEDDEFERFTDRTR